LSGLRQVKKAEKAIELCMPLTRSRTNDDGEKESFTASFVWKPHWFVLSQTEGKPIAEIEIPTWNKELVLMNLNNTEIAFDLMTGNTQGFARKRCIAVSPLAQLLHKTRFHELAYVVLGHTAEADFEDDDTPERNLQEVKAESVALLLCESLELIGGDYCRGYVQHWLDGEEIPERSAQRIFGAADRILKAGRNRAAVN
jgi:hypothetical protein